MSPDRVDELLGRYFEASASAEEVAELELRLRDDPAARSAFWAETRWQVALHTAVRIRASREDSAVSQAPADPLQPKGGDSRPPTPKGVPAAWLAAAAVIAVLVFGVGRTTRSPAGDRPRLAAIEGDVHIVSGDGADRTAVADGPLSDGETVRIRGAGTARLEYADGTRIELFDGAESRIDAAREGKRLALLAGRLRADIARQPANRPLILDTALARVRVLGTLFEVAVDADVGVRLELERGRVELLRDDEPPVVVEPESIARVPSAAAPIVVTQRPTMVAKPDRQAALGRIATRIGFLDPHRIVAVQTGTAAEWGEASEAEVVHVAPDSATGGLKPVAMSLPLIAFEEPEPHRLIVWNAETRRVERTIDVAGWRDAGAADGAADPVRLDHPAGVALSPGGMRLAVAERRGDVDAVLLVDLDRGVVRRTPGTRTRIMSCVASPDGTVFAIGRSVHGGGPRAAVVELISADSGEGVGELPVLLRTEKTGPGIVPVGLAFSESGGKLAVGLQGGAGGAGELQVWDVRDRVRVARLADVGFRPTVVALSPGGRHLAAADPAGGVSVWDLGADGTGASQVHVMLSVPRAADDVRFAPDGSAIAALVGQRQSAWWSMATVLPP